MRDDSLRDQQIYFNMGRANALYFRYETYRKLTDDMDNKQALPQWRLFTQWWRAAGYTQDEVNSVKSNYHP